MSKRSGDKDAVESKEPKIAAEDFGKPMNMMEWIEDSKESFLPPVCNKLM